MNTSILEADKEEVELLTMLDVPEECARFGTSEPHPDKMSCPYVA